MADEELNVDGQDYVVSEDGDQMRIGVREGGEVRWFDETVPASSLSDAPDRQQALRGVITAVADRGA